MKELSLGGGSLQSALQAFKGGADSVYVGLKEHSARKEAKNLTLEELAKLKLFATQNSKKIHVAINTLLDDEELNSLIPTLRSLELLEIDGLIVQDFGLAALIKDQFPSLALHGSTQMAVHSLNGILQLRDLGFERVVLARELTLKQIEELRKKCPDVELKVFIHGSLCYGFSGLCMASLNLTNRSANKGACSQVCRTYFSSDQQERDSTYPFSMTDLAIKENIRKLVDIGIDAFKVEGRMKSPLYSYYTAAYYRKILDNKKVTTEDFEKIEAQFSRQNLGGWTFSYGKEKPSENRKTPSLVTLNYPSHVGYKVATVLSLKREKEESFLEVITEKPLSQRDGLQILRKTSDGRQQALSFALKRLLDKNKKEIYESNNQETVTVVTDTNLNFPCPTTLYCISKSNLNLPLIDENSLKVYKYELNLKVTLTENNLSLETLNNPSFIKNKIKIPYDIKSQRALTKQNLEKNLDSIFLNSNNSYVTVSSLLIENKTPLAMEQLFYPSSVLKEIRRNFLSELEKIYLQELSSPNVENPVKKRELIKLPERESINGKFPFIDPITVNRKFKEGEVLEKLLPKVDNFSYLPLPPVTFNEEEQFKSLSELTSLNENIRVGLNNIAQLRWAKNNLNTECFIDVYLYVANKSTANYFVNTLANLVGMYHWVERPDLETANWAVTTTKPTVRLPLFISRSCYRYDSLGLSCENCPRKGSWEVFQSSKTYVVDVVDCITIVSEKRNATNLS